MKFENIAFVASEVEEARQACKELVSLYGNVPRQEADVIVALGGDGLMLQTLHTHMSQRVPIYGMNRGSVGFLMNEYAGTGLRERLEAARVTILRPLKMRAVCTDGSIHEALAVNEVSLLRETFQAARLSISIDGKKRLPELICDGALVSTPAGSTAYNFSAQGPIIPIGSPLLALTPISAFRPRRWRGALLRHRARVRFDVLESGKRPVSAVADHTEVRNVSSVEIAEETGIDLIMLFDHGHTLDEKILAEQFLH